MRLQEQGAQSLDPFDRANTHHYRTVTMDHEALIFLHIPKTAGTTLNRIIEWQYSPLSIFTIDPLGIRATPERFKTLSEQRRRQFRVVRGHMVYGIHEFLPQGATYITMLRDPVARLLSAYSFILRRPLNPMHRKLKHERLGVEAFIRLTPNRQNLQCRILAGVKDVTCDQRVLDIAKENITKSFSVVGLCERFEESLMLIAKTFGWEIPYYENRKVSKVRPAVEPGVVNMIQEHNRFDMELYEFARKRFEDTLHKKEDADETSIGYVRFNSQAWASEEVLLFELWAPADFWRAKSHLHYENRASYDLAQARRRAMDSCHIRRGCALAAGSLSRSWRRPRPAETTNAAVQRDLVYEHVNGHGVSRLDLYSPEMSPARCQLLFGIHGGGWSKGRKEGHMSGG